MKPPPRVGNILVFGYLLALLLGIAYALLGSSHILPKQVLAFEANMLAPFGSYDRENYDVMIEALSRDGTWRRVDPSTLVTLPRGKRTSFFLLASYNHRSDKERKAAYRTFATNLLTHLKKERRDAHGLRISIVRWPQSDDGIDVLRTPEQTTTDLLIQVP